MSFPTQNLNAFIELLEGNLFSTAECAELERLIEPLPDDTEALSKTISAWYLQSQYSHLRDAIFDKIDALADKVESDTGQRLPGANAGTPPPLQPPSKPELLNAIQRSQKPRNNDTSSGQTVES